jgi:Na+-driven multidrug efflux pump
MFSVLIGAILNTALDPLFIFAFDMGVRGAAVATVISQAISAAFVLAFLISSRSAIRLHLHGLRPKKDVILPILALGISPFVMQSTESLVGLVLNGTLSSFGDVYVGALTVMQSAMQNSSSISRRAVTQRLIRCVLMRLKRPLRQRCW